jgi:hypothetical protein
MNAFTKVLIVFVLILSIAFAAVQMVLFDLREDFAEKYNSERAKAAQSEKDLGDALANLKRTGDELTAAQADGKATKDLLDLEVDGLKTQLATLSAERDDKQRTIDAQAASLGAQVGLIQTVRTENDSLKGTNMLHVTKIAALQGDITKLGVQIDGLNATVTAKESDILGVKAERQHLARRVTAQAALIELAEERLGVSLPPRLQKEVIGHIAAVSDAGPNGTDVTIDRGKRDGVQLGYVFAICDGNVVKGLVEVTEIDERFCGGRAVMSKDHKAAVGFKVRNDLTL